MNTPYAPEAELAIIGSIFNDCGEEDLMHNLTSKGVTEDYFFEPRNRNLYKYAVECNAKGEDVNLIELASYAHQHPNKYGDPSHIAGLFRYSNSFVGMGRTIETLLEMKIRRDILIHSKSMQNNAMNLDSPVSKLITSCEELVEKVRDNKAPSSTGCSFGEATLKLSDHWKAVESNGGVIGLSLGMQRLDDEVGGLRAGDLFAIAGKPSEGKSVLMLQCATGSMKDGKRVLVFSLEMESEQVSARVNSCATGVNFSTCLNGIGRTKGDLMKIKNFVSNVHDKCKVYDDGGMTIDFIERTCKVENDREKVDLVVIDYWQLIESPDHKDEVRKFEYTSKKLKQLAKTIKCPVVTGSQLNDEGQPFGSRQISKDANILIKIINEGDSQGLLVAKSRNSKRGAFIGAQLDGSIQRFV